MSVALAGIDLPLRLSPKPALSVEEFWRFSAENPNLRMERTAAGDIHIMSPTRRRTGFQNAEILLALGTWAKADSSGFTFDSSTGFTLPDDSVLSPDAAWIRSSRWTPASEDNYTTILVPDFVVELRSHNDTLAELQDKMHLWMSNGVELAWLIDPIRRIVEIYQPGRDPAILDQPASVSGEGPVAGFVLDLTRIWA